MFERIAIMGAGSLGTILGAYISLGRQVDLIDANRAHVAALQENGACICGTENLNHIPVHAITPEEMEGTYDLFIYMAKQTYNDACFSQMKAHSHADTYICCCQNGLPEAAVCSMFPADHVFGAPVGWGATWLKPGYSSLNTAPAQRCFTLGSISGSVSPELLALKEILELMCPVELSDNLMGLRWSKLHVNAAYSGLSTVMGSTFGAVSDNDLAIHWAVRIARECMQICRATGIRMLPGHTSTGAPLDLMTLYNFHTPEEEDACITAVKDMNDGHRALIASMLQDLRKGLPCEVDSIVGVVVDAGEQAGIPTPYSTAARDVIRRKQGGEIPVDFFPTECFPGT